MIGTIGWVPGMTFQTDLQPPHGNNGYSHQMVRYSSAFSSRSSTRIEARRSRGQGVGEEIGRPSAATVYNLPRALVYPPEAPPSALPAYRQDNPPGPLRRSTRRAPSMLTDKANRMAVIYHHKGVILLSRHRSPSGWRSHHPSKRRRRWRSDGAGGCSLLEAPSRSAMSLLW